MAKSSGADDLALLKRKAAKKSSEEGDIVVNVRPKHATSAGVMEFEAVGPPAVVPPIDKMAYTVVTADAESLADLTRALGMAGFSYEQYVAAAQSKEFMEAVARHQHARDLPGLIRARTAVIGAGEGGNAYAYKTALDSTPDDPLSEDEAAYREQMASADSKTLRREIMAQISDLLIALERVDGKRYTVTEVPAGES